MGADLARSGIIGRGWSGPHRSQLWARFRPRSLSFGQTRAGSCGAWWPSFWKLSPIQVPAVTNKERKWKRKSFVTAGKTWSGAFPLKEDRSNPRGRGAESTIHQPPPTTNQPAGAETSWSVDWVVGCRVVGTLLLANPHLKRERYKSLIGQDEGLDGQDEALPGVSFSFLFL